MCTTSIKIICGVELVMKDVDFLFHHMYTYDLITLPSEQIIHFSIRLHCPHKYNTNIMTEILTSLTITKVSVFLLSWSYFVFSTTLSLYSGVCKETIQNNI